MRRALVVALLLAGCHDNKPTDTAWSLVLDQVRADGTVSVDTARAAWVLAIGPLPGVARPPGVTTTIADGTIAVHWMLAHESELSADERAIVAAKLAVPAPLKTDDPTHAKFAALVDVASQTIASKLGRPSPLSITTVINDTDVSPDGQPALAYASGYDALGDHHGPYAGCIAHFNPVVVSADQRLVDEAIPHEVFHCYETSMSPNLDEFSHVPDWINEGGAEWVGATLAGHALAPTDHDGSPSGSWIRCLTKPYRPLYELTYDGLCFFAELDANLRSPWTNFDGIMTGYFVGGSQAALMNAIGGNQSFFKSWAQSVVREPRLGVTWDLTGPGITADRVSITNVDIANGGSANDLLPPVSSNDYLLRPSAEVLMLRAPDWTTIHSLAGNGNDAPAGDWCVGPSDCDCPAESVRAGQHLPSLPADDYYMSVSGGLAGSQWFAGGMSFADFCNSDRVDKCVQGTWVLQTVGMSTSICTVPTPIGTIVTFDKSGASIEDFEGSATVTCSANGMTSMTTLGGHDTATVTADHGYMIVTDVDNSAVTVNSMLDGVDLGMGLSSVFRSMTGMGTTLSYTCLGNNTLLLTGAQGTLYTLFKSP